jgi:hypothetical protein
LSGQGQIFSNGRIADIFLPKCYTWGKTEAGKRKRDFVRVGETETEVTVVDENEVEGSDKENEQEEQTEPVIE